MEGRVLFLLRKMDSNDGITSYCNTLARGLRVAHIAPDLICAGIELPDGEKHRWNDLQGNLGKAVFLPRLRKVPDPVTLALVLRHIRARKITAINVHGLGMLLWGKVLGGLTGLPVVATYHPSVHGELSELSNLAQRPLSPSEKMVLRSCAPDRLVVLSSESAQYLAAECPTIAERIVKVSGAVDDDHFRPPTAEERAAARRRLNLSDNELIVLHVGRMSWNKGHDVLIDAVREVRSALPDSTFRCIFVGSGGEEEKIKEYALGDDSDRATFMFLGFREDLREVIWASDIFALPSRLEGFALAVVEAMCAGLVAVRTPSGGAKDQIIEGETGIVVPFDDPGKLADALTLLADAEKRAEMRVRSLAYSRVKFTRAAMTSGMLAVYQDARTSKRPAPGRRRGPTLDRTLRPRS